MDCGACERVCPVRAIFEESNVPPQWAHYTEKNKRFFEENQDVKAAQGRGEIGPGGLGRTAVPWPPDSKTMLKKAVSARLIKKVQMQGGAR